MMKKSQGKAVFICMKAAVRQMHAICVFWPVLCFAVRLPDFLFMRQMAQIWSKWRGLKKGGFFCLVFWR